MARKRTNGEGSIHRRPNGLWEFQIMLGYRPNGRRRIKCIYARTQRELKQKVKVFMDELDNGGRMDGQMSFSEWADVWYEGMKGQVSDTTYEGYAFSVKILKEYFKDTPLEEIKAMQVEEFLKAMIEEGRSKSYIKKLRAMLSQIMKKAEANDLINKNPVAVAETVKVKEEVKPATKDSFTVEEMKALMDKLPQNRIGWSIRLMLGTGMRTQEMMGLEPKHIAEDGSMIHVQQALVMVKGSPKIGPPKSQTSCRDIPVPKTLWDTAKALRGTTEQYIWHGETTPLCNPCVFRRQYATELARIPEVRHLTPHCCRHTYVSQLQAAGVDIETIQHLAGHSDINMTEHYLHVQKEVKYSAVAKLDDVLSA